MNEGNVQCTNIPLDSQSSGGLGITREGVVCLMQIAGGGRLRLKSGEREWWSKPPHDAAWEAYQTSIGQTCDSKEAAEEVIANLI